MQPTRKARLESVIQEEVAMLLCREIRDPRIPSITVTRVTVTPDARQAIVHVARMSVESTDVTQDETARNARDSDCLKGLDSASGFMRRHLAKVLTIRHIPALAFKIDHGLENSLRVHELLNRIHEKDPSK